MQPDAMLKEAFFFLLRRLTH